MFRNHPTGNFHPQGLASEKGLFSSRSREAIDGLKRSHRHVDVCGNRIDSYPHAHLRASGDGVQVVIGTMGCIFVFAIWCLNRLPSEEGLDRRRSPNILSERTHLHKDEMRFHWYFLVPPEGKQGLSTCSRSNIHLCCGDDINKNLLCSRNETE